MNTESHNPNPSLTVGTLMASLESGKKLSDLSHVPGVVTLANLAMAWFRCDLTPESLKRLRFEGAIQLVKCLDGDDENGIDCVDVYEMATALRSIKNRLLDRCDGSLERIEAGRRDVDGESMPGASGLPNSGADPGCVSATPHGPDLAFANNSEQSLKHFLNRLDSYRNCWHQLNRNTQVYSLLTGPDPSQVILLARARNDVVNIKGYGSLRILWEREGLSLEQPDQIVTFVLKWRAEISLAKKRTAEDVDVLPVSMFAEIIRSALTESAKAAPAFPTSLFQTDSEEDKEDGAPTGETPPMPPEPTKQITPKWDNARRELWLENRIIKRFDRNPAHKQVALLEHFQAKNWEGCIESPWSEDRETTNKACVNLNKGLEQYAKKHGLHAFPSIRFRSDGTGDCICWDLVNNG